jgi:hypothetical protein
MINFLENLYNKVSTMVDVVYMFEYDNCYFIIEWNKNKWTYPREIQKIDIWEN